MAVPINDLEKIREEGLKALKERLGTEGMIKFIQITQKKDKKNLKM